MVALVVPPLVALATISVIVFVQAMSTMTDTRQMSQHLQTSEAIRQLIYTMQKERDITCILLETDR